MCTRPTKTISKDGKQIETLKSYSFDIDKYGKEVVELFWDARNVEMGSYDGAVNINFGDHKAVYSVNLDVIPHEDYLKKKQDVIVVKDKMSTAELLIIGVLMIMIIVLLIVLIYIGILLKKRKI